MNPPRPCRQCGRLFEATRTDARYCTSRCRTAACRAAKRERRLQSAYRQMAAARGIAQEREELCNT
jgi:hypothetical protein